MAHLSGTFSDANPGRLVCTLSGTFVQGTSRDAGFPQGTSNLLVRAVVGGVAGIAIDRFAPSAEFELNYPGGGVSWSISTQTVSSSSSGTASYGFTNLKLVIKLHKAV